MSEYGLLENFFLVAVGHKDHAVAVDPRTASFHNNLA